MAKKDNDPNNISVEECARITGKSQPFIRKAIMNGSFPGSYTSTNGKDSFHIPRKAFEEYMTTWNPGVKDELVIALTEAYMELIKRKRPRNEV